MRWGNLTLHKRTNFNLSHFWEFYCIRILKFTNSKMSLDIMPQLNATYTETLSPSCLLWCARTHANCLRSGEIPYVAVQYDLTHVYSNKPLMPLVHVLIRWLAVWFIHPWAWASVLKIWCEQWKRFWYIIKIHFIFEQRVIMNITTAGRMTRVA